MRISDLTFSEDETETDAGRDQLIAQVAAFNRTDWPFDRSVSLTHVLSQRAQSCPDAVALEDGTSSMSYAQLWREARRVAQWIDRYGPPRQSPVGVMSENSNQMVVAILAVLLSDRVYLPLNPDLPQQRTARILQDAGAGLVMFGHRHLRAAHRLLWDCPQLRAGFCFDTDDLTQIREEAAGLMRVELWDHVGETAQDAITGGGWIDSFTGQPLAQVCMDEYSANVRHKLKAILKPHHRVLEIGCATGLTMREVAPHVARYVGVDFSASILAHAIRLADDMGLRNTEFAALAADEIDRLQEGAFDVVILNSVVQNFDGHGYLMQVLRKAVALCAPKAQIFLGDVMDLDRKAALIEDLTRFRETHGDDSLRTKLDWSHELFLSREWIEDLRYTLRGTTGAQHSDKIYTVACELTDYRFDSLIEIDKSAPWPSAGAPHKRLCDRSALDEPGVQDVALPEANGESLCYLIYTSGTTGEPKGVAVRHRNIHNYVAWAARHYFGNGGGNCALFTSPAFDLTLTSIFVPLYLGRCIHPIAEVDLTQALRRAFLDRRGLAHAIDTVKLTPSHITMLGELGLRDSAVRTVIVGGEVFTEPQRRILMETCPQLRAYNEYGPTETTIGCAIHEVAENDLHIGRPIDNTEILILDEALNPVPIGFVGELCVAGDGVAAGFWRRPDATAERFIDHPFKPGATLYRTGDSARWRDDGELVLLGRIDHQVKIRGNRIELGEIEAALCGFADVREAVVNAVPQLHAGAHGVKEMALVAYILAPPQIDLEALQTHLAETLPAVMVPAHILVLEHFPTTPNGKIDRRKLSLPEAECATDRSVTPPEGPLECALADLWRAVLDIELVGREDDFFALGGHSLSAVSLTARVQNSLKISCSVADVFAAPVLSQLAARLTQANPAMYRPISRVVTSVEGAVSYPMTSMQRRLWVMQMLQPGNTGYVVQETLMLKGIDAERLVRALGRLMQRHEALRTRFPTSDAVDLVAMVEPVQTMPKPPIAIMDWRSRMGNPTLLARALSGASLSSSINLSKGPVWRATVVKLAQEQVALILTMHHIITDGWSMGILIDDLVALYQDDEQAPHAPQPQETDDVASEKTAAARLSYADFAHWHHSLVEALGTQQRYWLTKLADLPPPLALPTDFPRPPERDGRGAVDLFHFDAAELAALNGLARGRGCTLFMVLATGLSVMLRQMTGQSDMLIGTPVSGRRHPDLHDIVGFFVNTVVLRLQPGPQDSYASALDRTRRCIIEALDNQDYPFDRLVQEVDAPRDPARSPLFDVMLSLQNQPLSTHDLGEASVSRLEVSATSSRFDLSFEFAPDDVGMTLAVEYATSLYEPDTIQRMVTRLKTVLAQMVTAPETRLVRAACMPPDERALVLRALNETETTYPAESSIHDRIWAQARRTPHADALRFEGRIWSYGEMVAAADALAARMRQAGAGPESLVGLYLERSADLVIAILATLRVGAAWVPLDRSAPLDRVADICAQIDPAVVISPHPDPFVPLGLTCLSVLEEAATGGAEPLAPESMDVHPDGAAYAIFTSGSTGQPKGVVNTHRAILNRINWMQEAYPLTPEDRVLQKTPFTFDVSVWEFLWPLREGACLVVAPPEAHKDPQALLDLIEQEQITTLHFVPSMLQIFLQVLTPANAQSLRQVFCSGEALGMGSVRLFHNLSSAALHNLYGPTEAAIDVSYFDTRRLEPKRDIYGHTLGAEVSGASVPIGAPIANTQLYVLDAAMCAQPVGIPGELYIGGDNLARGYLGRSDLTAERFVPDPYSRTPGVRLYRTGDLARWQAKGVLEYLGRADFQIKRAGVRIELGEIEHALSTHPQVEAAVVLAVSPQAEDTGQAQSDLRLVALITTLDGSEVIPDGLRSALAQRLPSSMMPDHIQCLPHMPLTANGKLDRQTLTLRARDSLQVAASSREVVWTPTTPLERQLLQAWQEVLGEGEAFDPQSDFFAAGGNSLRAIALVTTLRQALARDVAMVLPFQAPTLGQQLRVLAAKAEPASRPIVQLSPPVAQRHGADPDAGQRLFALPPLLGHGIAMQTLATALRDVEVHGLDFDPHRPEDLQASLSPLADAIEHVQPHGALSLTGYSGGGVLAHHVARLLETRGRQVARVILLDSFPRPEVVRRSKAAILSAIEADIEHFAAFMRKDPGLSQLLRNDAVVLQLKARMMRVNRFLDAHPTRTAIEAPIRLITSEQFHADARLADWQALTRKGLIQTTGSGGHLEMLLPGFVEKNAIHIRAALMA